jgi:hypothetical protein
MKKDVIKTKKTKLIESINKTWSSAQMDSKNAMEKAIKTGEMLIDLKKITPAGKWKSNFEEVNSWLTFGYVQATKLMKMADNQELLKIVSGEDILSINAAQEAIKNATEEQKAEAEKIRIEEQVEADRIAAKKAMEAIDKKNKADLEKKKQKEGWGKDEVIEGELLEVKKEEQKKYGPVADDEPKNKTVQDELEEMLDQQFLDNKYLSEENASLVKILESNDQVAGAITEAQKLREEIVLLNSRINQLIHESNAAKNAAKMWKSKYEKLAKEVS